MLVYLFRHGVAAERDAAEFPDDDLRPLTPSGRRRTRSAALGLRALGIDPDLVLVSSLVRARETALIAAESLGYAVERIVETEALRPEALPRDLLEQLRKLDADVVICVGHAPNLDRIVASVLRSRVPVTKLKKAGLAGFELGTGPRSLAQLRCLLEPRALRQLGRIQA